MNYNDKDQELNSKKVNHMDQNLEIDDMNIKSHLNASLDLSGIQVSEDLINRTLQAIKQQEKMDHEEETTPKEAERKIIPWSRYVRRVAGVAAAVFVVVIGFNALTRLDIGSKKSADNSTQSEMDTRMMDEMAEKSSESTAMNDAEVSIASVQEEETTMDAASTESVAEEPAATENQSMGTAEISSTEDGSNDSNEDRKMEAADASDTAFAKEDSDTSSLLYHSNAGASDTLGFRDIFLSDSQQVEQITIFDDKNKERVTLTDRNDIENFYDLMDQQHFQTASDVVVESQYTIEIKAKGEEEDIYTMTIGNGVSIQTVLGDTVSHSVYQSVDEMSLKQSLQEFIHDYQQ